MRFNPENRLQVKSDELSNMGMGGRESIESRLPGRNGLMGNCTEFEIMRYCTES